MNRNLVAVAALSLAALAFVRPEATSEWAYVKGGKLAYKATPAGDRIMDFSYAGYMGGGVAIPDVPVRKTVKPSGGEDDAATIQAAIEEVAKLPLENGVRGAVLLEPGVYPCSETLRVSANGVVLRGSGESGANASTIKLTGRPHLAISVGAAEGRRAGEPAPEAETKLADAYVPSGAASFNVADARELKVGDTVVLRKPVTAEWVKFMGMDDMVRDGKPQTWIKTGSTVNAERKIAALSGNTVTVDVPLSDNYDAKFAGEKGTVVAKIKPPARVSQAGVEHLHVEAPPMAINHTEAHFQALHVNGEDCWARDMIVDETMNSVSTGGRRITLRNVVVNRKARSQGASRPAEFAPNGSQVLVDRCEVHADNVWFLATGAGISGPIVILNCTFSGEGGRCESHQRWSTGMLYDNVDVGPGGGLEFRNRGSMGSGHGWTMGWGVMWNCRAKDYVVQNPPGAVNWMIGCAGENKSMPRPFGTGPLLAKGTEDSTGTPVTPKSLYLTQLEERLGARALKNIGY